ncbi:MAG TPA: SAM-dependent methyltransferase [Pseudomonas sp.]|nr:SAM-dependent methyltransferase [Pseudomonas sp.]
MPKQPPEHYPLQLQTSWQANAQAWTDAVRGQRIASRRLATDAAIVQAIGEVQPQRALDIGCGEGWLCRAMSQQGIEAVGIDGSPALIEAARRADPNTGRYQQCSYAELAAGMPELGRFDLLVANFALLEEQLAPLLRALQGLTAKQGKLLIQTLHPKAAMPAWGYSDGWQIETFASLAGGFVQPMPWYYRTTESWLQLLAGSGWQLHWLRQPQVAGSEHPASLLLLLESAGGK